MNSKSTNLSTMMIKIRLEASSYSNDERGSEHVSPIARDQNGSFRAVVGLALEKTESIGIADGIEIGQRLCCMVDLEVRAKDQVDAEIPAYLALSISPDLDSSTCVAVLPSALRIFTAIHAMARLRKDESILIACPNDLNTTAIGLQICENLGLKAFGIVADEKSESLLREMTGSTNILKIDPSDPSSFRSTVDQSSGGLGFDCILDFENHDFDPDVPSISLGSLIRSVTAFGRLVTDRSGNPIRSTDVNILNLKSTSIHFLNDRTWHLSPLHLGRYKHFLADIIDLIERKKLRPIIDSIVKSDDLQDGKLSLNERTPGCIVIKFQNA